MEVSYNTLNNIAPTTKTDDLGATVPNTLKS